MCSRQQRSAVLHSLEPQHAEQARHAAAAPPVSKQAATPQECLRHWCSHSPLRAGPAARRQPGSRALQQPRRRGAHQKAAGARRAPASASIPCRRRLARPVPAPARAAPCIVKGPRMPVQSWLAGALCSPEASCDTGCLTCSRAVPADKPPQALQAWLAAPGFQGTHKWPRRAGASRAAWHMRTAWGTTAASTWPCPCCTR